MNILDDDCELGFFIGDLVGMLERGDQAEDLYLALGDLLVAAQQCTEVCPNEIWMQCEGIV